MAKKIFSVLLVGLGNIGMGYDWKAPKGRPALTHASAFSRSHHFRLAGAVDPNPIKRRQFKRFYGGFARARVTHVRAKERFDVVVIATPTYTHFHILTKILARNHTPQLILCEKPMSDSVKEAKKICRLCQRHKVMLRVNYPRRVIPSSVKIENWIRKGRIEGPFRGNVWYSKGLIHSGSHFLNLLENWLGSVKKIEKIRHGRRLGRRDGEPDLAFTFGRGRVNFLAVPEENFSHHEINLVAKNGILRYQDGGQNISWFKYAPPQGQKHTKAFFRQNIISRGESGDQGKVVKEVLRCLKNMPSRLCTGEEALQTLLLLEKALKS